LGKKRGAYALPPLRGLSPTGGCSRIIGAGPLYKRKIYLKLNKKIKFSKMFARPVKTEPKNKNIFYLFNYTKYFKGLPINFEKNKNWPSSSSLRLPASSWYAVHACILVKYSHVDTGAFDFLHPPSLKVSSLSGPTRGGAENKRMQPNPLPRRGGGTSVKCSIKTEEKTDVLLKPLKIKKQSKLNSLSFRTSSNFLKGSSDNYFINIKGSSKTNFSKSCFLYDPLKTSDIVESSFKSDSTFRDKLSGQPPASSGASMQPLSFAKSLNNPLHNLARVFNQGKDFPASSGSLSSLLLPAPSVGPPSPEGGGAASSPIPYHPIKRPLGSGGPLLKGAASDKTPIPPEGLLLRMSVQGAFIGAAKQQKGMQKRKGAGGRSTTFGTSAWSLPNFPMHTFLSKKKSESFFQYLFMQNILSYSDKLEYNLTFIGDSLKKEKNVGQESGLKKKTAKILENLNISSSNCIYNPLYSRGCEELSKKKKVRPCILAYPSGAYPTTPDPLGSGVNKGLIPYGGDAGGIAAVEDCVQTSGCMVAGDSFLQSDNPLRGLSDCRKEKAAGGLFSDAGASLDVLQQKFLKYGHILSQDKIFINYKKPFLCYWLLPFLGLISVLPTFLEKANDLNGLPPDIFKGASMVGKKNDHRGVRMKPLPRRGGGADAGGKMEGRSRSSVDRLSINLDNLPIMRDPHSKYKDSLDSLFFYLYEKSFFEGQHPRPCIPNPPSLSGPTRGGWESLSEDAGFSFISPPRRGQAASAPFLLGGRVWASMVGPKSDHRGAFYRMQPSLSKGGPLEKRKGGRGSYTEGLQTKNLFSDINKNFSNFSLAILNKNIKNRSNFYWNWYNLFLSAISPSFLTSPPQNTTPCIQKAGCIKEQTLAQQRWGESLLLDAAFSFIAPPRRDQALRGAASSPIPPEGAASDKMPIPLEGGLMSVQGGRMSVQGYVCASMVSDHRGAEKKSDAAPQIGSNSFFPNKIFYLRQPIIKDSPNIFQNFYISSKFFADNATPKGLFASSISTTPRSSGSTPESLPDRWSPFLFEAQDHVKLNASHNNVSVKSSYRKKLIPTILMPSFNRINTLNNLDNIRGCTTIETEKDIYFVGIVKDKAIEIDMINENNNGQRIRWLFFSRNEITQGLSHCRPPSEKAPAIDGPAQSSTASIPAAYNPAPYNQHMNLTPYKSLKKALLLVDKTFQPPASSFVASQPLDDFSFPAPPASAPLRGVWAKNPMTFLFSQWDKPSPKGRVIPLQKRKGTEPPSPAGGVGRGAEKKRGRSSAKIGCFEGSRKLQILRQPSSLNKSTKSLEKTINLIFKKNFFSQPLKSTALGNPCLNLEGASVFYPPYIPLHPKSPLPERAPLSNNNKFSPVINSNSEKSKLDFQKGLLNRNELYNSIFEGLKESLNDILKSKIRGKKQQNLENKFKLSLKNNFNIFPKVEVVKKELQYTKLYSGRSVCFSHQMSGNRSLSSTFFEILNSYKNPILSFRDSSFFNWRNLPKNENHLKLRGCIRENAHTLPPNKKTPPQGGWVGGPPFKRGSDAGGSDAGTGPEETPHHKFAVSNLTTRGTINGKFNILKLNHPIRGGNLKQTVKKFPLNYLKQIKGLQPRPCTDIRIKTPYLPPIEDAYPLRGGWKGMHPKGYILSDAGTVLKTDYSGKEDFFPIEIGLNIKESSTVCKKIFDSPLSNRKVENTFENSSISVNGPPSSGITTLPSAFSFLQSDNPRRGLSDCKKRKESPATMQPEDCASKNPPADSWMQPDSQTQDLIPPPPKGRGGKEKNFFLSLSNYLNLITKNIKTVLNPYKYRLTYLPEINISRAGSFSRYKFQKPTSLLSLDLLDASDPMEHPAAFSFLQSDNPLRGLSDCKKRKESPAIMQPFFFRPTPPAGEGLHDRPRGCRGGSPATIEPEGEERKKILFKHSFPSKSEKIFLSFLSKAKKINTLPEDSKSWASMVGKKNDHRGAFYRMQQPNTPPSFWEGGERQNLKLKSQLKLNNMYSIISLNNKSNSLNHSAEHSRVNYPRVMSLKRPNKSPCTDIPGHAQHTEDAGPSSPPPCGGGGPGYMVALDHAAGAFSFIAPKSFKGGSPREKKSNRILCPRFCIREELTFKEAHIPKLKLFISKEINLVSLRVTTARIQNKGLRWLFFSRNGINPPRISHCRKEKAQNLTIEGLHPKPNPPSLKGGLGLGFKPSVVKHSLRLSKKGDIRQSTSIGETNHPGKTLPVIETDVLNILTKKNNLKIKRRLKKMKKETRRRKKRKIFYPRPSWITFSLYKKFLTARYLPLKNKTMEVNLPYNYSGNNTNNISFLREIELAGNIAARPPCIVGKAFGEDAAPPPAGEGGSPAKPTPLRGMGAPFEAGLSLERHSELNFSQIFKYQNTPVEIYRPKDFYRTSSTVVSDLKRVLMKSNWLRNYLNSYFEKVKNIYQEMQNSSKKVQLTLKLRNFILNFYGQTYMVDANFNTDMQKNMNSPLNSILSDAGASSPPPCGGGGRGAGSFSRNIFQTGVSSNPPESSAKKSLNLVEYNRLTYQRIQRIIYSIKDNLNLNGEMKSRSKKLSKNIRAFIKRDYKTNSTLQRTNESINQNGLPNFWTKLIKNNILKFNTFTSYGYDELSNYRNATDILTNFYFSSPKRNNLFWALNKSNTTLPSGSVGSENLYRSGSPKKLWDSYKIREISKSNRTKKIIFKILNSPLYGFLTNPSTSFDGFNHILEKNYISSLSEGVVKQDNISSKNLGGYILDPSSSGPAPHFPPLPLGGGESEAQTKTIADSLQDHPPSNKSPEGAFIGRAYAVGRLNSSIISSLPTKTYIQKTEQKLINIENKLKLLGLYSNKIEKSYKNYYFRHLKQELLKSLDGRPRAPLWVPPSRGCSIAPRWSDFGGESAWSEKKTTMQILRQNLTIEAQNFASSTPSTFQEGGVGRDFTRMQAPPSYPKENFNYRDKVNINNYSKISNNYFYWWTEMVNPKLSLEQLDQKSSTLVSIMNTANKVNSSLSTDSLQSLGLSPIFTFLFHFCTLISFISLGGIRTLIKFYFILISKISKIISNISLTIFAACHEVTQLIFKNHSRDCIQDSVSILGRRFGCTDIPAYPSGAEDAGGIAAVGDGAKNPMTFLFSQWDKPSPKGRVIPLQKRKGTDSNLRVEKPQTSPRWSDKKTTIHPTPDPLGSGVNKGSKIIKGGYNFKKVSISMNKIIRLLFLKYIISRNNKFNSLLNSSDLTQKLKENKEFPLKPLKNNLSFFRSFIKIYDLLPPVGAGLSLPALASIANWLRLGITSSPTAINSQIKNGPFLFLNVDINPVGIDIQKRKVIEALPLTPPAAWKSSKNKANISMQPVRHKQFVLLLKKYKLNLSYYSLLKVSNIFYICNKTSFYVYLLLLKSIDLFAAPISFIYKFFEKPGEYVVENLAYNFLVEWSADLITTIPDTVDVNAYLNFSKINRNISPFILLKTSLVYSIFLEANLKFIPVWLTPTLPILNLWKSQPTWSSPFFLLGPTMQITSTANIPGGINSPAALRRFESVQNLTIEAQSATAATNYPPKNSLMQNLPYPSGEGNEGFLSRNTPKADTPPLQMQDQLKINYLFPFLFIISNSILKRILNSTFLIFIQQLCEPDLDYINRQKKGIIFWDIWGEYLKQVAEDNSINIYELTTDKEEQIKLLSKYEEIWGENNNQVPRWSDFAQKQTTPFWGYPSGAWSDFAPADFSFLQSDNPLRGLSDCEKRKESPATMQPDPPPPQGGGAPFEVPGIRLPGSLQSLPTVLSQAAKQLPPSSASKGAPIPPRGVGFGGEPPSPAGGGGRKKNACILNPPGGSGEDAGGKKSEVSKFNLHTGKIYKNKVFYLKHNINKELFFNQNLVPKGLSQFTGSGKTLPKFGFRPNNFTSVFLENWLYKKSGSNLFKEAGIVSQFLSYQGKDTDLFIDLHPPKSFWSMPSLKYSVSVQQPLGSIVCQIFSGIFYKQISKNILVVGSPGLEKSLLIQAMAGETELKIITDNANRYALVYRGVAVGIKLLRDVFEALSLHTPCIFLIEDIHAIGERRPFLIQGGACSNNSSEYNKNQSMQGLLLKEKGSAMSMSREILYKSSKYLLSHYKKPYKEPRNLATNHFSFTFLFSNFGGGSKIRNGDLKPSGTTLSTQVFKKENQFNDKNIGVNNEKNNNRAFSPGGQRNLESLGKKPIDIGKTANISGFFIKQLKTLRFGDKRPSASTIKNIYSSSLEIKTDKSQLLAPPASSPFSVLINPLKEENAGQKERQPGLSYHKKLVKEMPWFGLPGEQFSLVSKYNYSIRVKVALLADLVLSNLSVKLDMITDLLVIIDSVKGNRGFVVFATTHVPYILDPALRRPGRFDETISLPLISTLFTRWSNYRYNVKYLSDKTFSEAAVLRKYCIPLNSTFSKGITLDLFKYNLIDQLSFSGDQNSYSSNPSCNELINYLYRKNSTRRFPPPASLCIRNKKPCTDIRIKTPYLPPIEDAYPLRGGWKGMGISPFGGDAAAGIFRSEDLSESKRVYPSFKNEVFRPLKNKISNKQLLKLKSKNYSFACKSLISFLLFTFEAPASDKMTLHPQPPLVGPESEGGMQVQRGSFKTLLFENPSKTTYFSEKTNSIKWIGILKDANIFGGNQDYSVYLSLFGYPLMLKIILMSLIGGKIGESFLMNSFKRNHKINFKSSSSGSPCILGSDNAGGAKICTAPYNTGAQVFPLENLFLFNFDSTWKHASSLLFSYLQKRQCSMLGRTTKNITLFGHTSKLLSFNNKYSLMEAPNPPISNILLPSKRFENYKRTFNNQFEVSSQPLKNTYNSSIFEKLQLHQQQRLLRRLYKYPIKEFFNSPYKESAHNFNNSYLTLAPLEKTNCGTAAVRLTRLSSTNWCYKNLLYNRHRTYLTNQWWNAQQGEHNVETTFLSDIDWRYTFVPQTKGDTNLDVASESGDVNIDFPDSEQFYNPRNRRWFLTNGDWNYWFNIQSELKDIYNHYIYDCFAKAYKYLDKNREIIDFYSELLHQTPLYSPTGLSERELLNLYKRFLTGC
jgi:SpoVK/Ycf46/Vps4 family AAA+-type ATPase